MDIKEIRNKKLDLELKILNLVQNFEKATLCHINRISIMESKTFESIGVVKRVEVVEIDINIQH